MALLILGLTLPIAGAIILGCFLYDYSDYKSDCKIVKRHKYVILKLKEFISFYNLSPENYKLQKYSVVFSKPFSTRKYLTDNNICIIFTNYIEMLKYKIWRKVEVKKINTEKERKELKEYFEIVKKQIEEMDKDV